MTKMIKIFLLIFFVTNYSFESILTPFPYYYQTTTTTTTTKKAKNELIRIKENITRVECPICQVFLVKNKLYFNKI
jgi:hypothetical protein